MTNKEEDSHYIVKGLFEHVVQAPSEIAANMRVGQITVGNLRKVESTTTKIILEEPTDKHQRRLSDQTAREDN